MQIALVEDSTLLRAGLEQLLRAQGHRVTTSVTEAVTLLHRLGDTDPDELPDVVVLDVRLPPTFTDEGIRAALTIRERWPRMGVLVLSQYVERRHTAELITPGGGGVGYLLKDRVAAVTDFLEALERVRTGGTAFDPAGDPAAAAPQRRDVPAGSAVGPGAGSARTHRRGADQSGDRGPAAPEPVGGREVRLGHLR